MSNLPVSNIPTHSPAPLPLSNGEDIPTDGLSRRLALVALIVGLALVALARWNMLAVPFERDEGEYAVMAQAILRGELPYVAAYNMKLPGVYYSYAAIFTLFGSTDFDVHFALLLLTTLSALGIAWLGYRLISPWGGSVAAVSFAALSASERVYGFTANAEHFVVFWFVVAAIAAVSVVLSERASIDPRQGQVVRFAWSLIGGVAIGLAFLMKQHALFYVLLAGVWGGGRLLIAWRDRTLVRSRLIELLLIGVGVVLPWAVVVGYFAARGGLERLWFWTVVYARHYVSERTFSEGCQNLFSTSTHLGVSAWPMGLLALCGVIGIVRSSRPLAEKSIWLAFAGCSLLTTVPGLLFREHYFLMALPALGLMAGHGVEFLSRGLSAWNNARSEPALPPTGIVTATLAVLSLAYVFAVETPVWSMGPIDLSRYAFGQNPFPEAVTIAAELRRRTSADDTIAVIGSEPQIYSYAGRRPATGYLYTYPLMEHHPYAEGMHDEFIRDLEQRRPAYVVLVLVPTSWLATKTSVSKLLAWTDTRLPALYTLVGVANIPEKGQAREFYWDNPELARLPRSDLPLQVWKRK